jgi:hypothetical protein
MQDWEYEVADKERFDEFLEWYSTGAANDDERFSLMEILIQCVEDMDADANAWSRIKPILVANRELHIDTVRYWAALAEDNLEMEAENPDHCFQVSGRMRQLLREFDSSQAAKIRKL